MKENVYKTKDGILELIFIDWEEPNNGRELFIPKITKKGIDITDEICKNWGCWNRIPMYIEFEFSNPKFPIVFIPFEKNFILYEYLNNKISLINLESKIRHNRFIKNKFYDERVLFLTNRMIKIKNLISNEYYKLETMDNELFTNAEITNDNMLLIKMNIIEEKGVYINTIDEKTIIIDLKNVV